MCICIESSTPRNIWEHCAPLQQTTTKDQQHVNQKHHYGVIPLKKLHIKNSSEKGRLLLRATLHMLVFLDNPYNFSLNISRFTSTCPCPLGFLYVNSASAAKWSIRSEPKTLKSVMSSFSTLPNSTSVRSEVSHKLSKTSEAAFSISLLWFKRL